MGRARVGVRTNTRTPDLRKINRRKIRSSQGCATREALIEKGPHGQVLEANVAPKEGGPSIAVSHVEVCAPQ